MPWEHHVATLDSERYRADSRTAYKSTSAMALFSGPWRSIAASAFYSTPLIEPLDGSSLETAYQNAIAATQGEWERMEATCSDPYDMFGQGAADGACVFLNSHRATCFWLGATPILHLRDGKIESQNTPHTLYYAMIAQGHQPQGDQYHRVAHKSFVSEANVESLVWPTLPGDRILILPDRIRPSLLSEIASICTTAPKTDAEKIAALVAVDCQPYPAVVILSECIA